MGSLICVCQPARFLFNLHILRVCGKRKRHNSLIAKLFLHLAVINSISCNSGWCSGLETEHFYSQLFQRISKIISCLQTIWACIITYIAINTSCFQIGSGTQNNSLTMINSSGIGLYTCDFSILYKKLCYLSLADSQVILILQCLSHLVTVSLLICLCAKRMNCRSLGTIQHLGLDKGLVNIFSHLASKSVQFTHQMALGASSYIRVTRHKSNTIYTDSEHHGF